MAATIWAIAAIAILGMLVRPWRSPEWVWAVGGALALVGLRLVTWPAAAAAVWRGADVYAFLAGIMALAELARTELVFAWLSDEMLRRGRGSQRRLFALVYGIGAVVTVLLSNDTTAVVLTPAVIAALARTRVNPLPYLYACAFVANAASFVLPISNPANLVVFGRGIPPLVPWVEAFGLAALATTAIVFLALRIASRRSLQDSYVADSAFEGATARTRMAAIVVGLAAAALLLAAALGWNLGIAALAAAIVATAVVSMRRPRVAVVVARDMAWQIVPLVAGLFVIVQGLDASGAISSIRLLLSNAAGMSAVAGNALIIGAFSIADNVFNNLPVALAGGFALQSMHAAPALAHATLVGVDLGPNLSVTGSLATLLWLLALRREGIEVTAWQFMRLGAIVTVPALIVASLLVR